MGPGGLADRQRSGRESGGGDRRPGVEEDGARVGGIRPVCRLPRCRSRKMHPAGDPVEAPELRPKLHRRKEIHPCRKDRRRFRKGLSEGVAGEEGGGSDRSANRPRSLGARRSVAKSSASGGGVAASRRCLHCGRRETIPKGILLSPDRPEGGPSRDGGL